ncbi:MAG: polysaccharide biosynthesis tyrosine autokinase [Myxacorys chilensis ATA2-1-KO14]|jgi:capsular exopolysaccharide synthesis family protein|nr:polysaccharide biosynthesis tyrosine autokinase [Myxacorys chilensis ATA2-1-KO14]
MESKINSQALAVNGSNKQLRRLPLTNAIPHDGEGEGGLNFGQVAAVLRRKIPIVLGVTTVVSSAALLKAVTSEPIYQSTFEILTKPVTAESQVISSVPETLGNREQQKPEPEKALDETKLKLLKSPNLLEPVVQTLKPKYPDLTYDRLSSSLEATQLPNSEVLRVSFQDSNREKVREVLTLVSQAYLNYSLEERLVDVRQGIEFVDQQIPKLQQRVETTQDRLQTFRQRYNLIDPELTSKQLAEQTATIAQQRLETDVKLEEGLALDRDLRQQLTQRDQPASSALRENTRYQNLLNQLLEVEAQVAKTSGVFQEKAPQVQLLRSQLANLQPLLEREGGRSQGDVESQVRGLKARQAILMQTEDLLKQQVKQLSVVSRQYTDIQQELKIGTDNLNQFLAKREALRIDAGQRTTPWQILTPLSKPKLASAGIKQTGALGVILGLLLGVGTALLLEKLSNVLHTPEEVKDTAKLPMLGVIPFNAELAETEKQFLATGVPMPEPISLMRQMRQRLSVPKSESAYLYDSSPFSEAFRSLYTNIRLLNPDTLIRSLAISSPSPGEGKSTVALYLAQAAAALGQRVLLVDTDFRCPQLHVRLQLPNLQGLSNIVSLEVEFDQAVQQSPVEPNLFVLTVGQVPPDPTRLLSSKKMQTLMQQFEEMYDLVVYDVPPLLDLADAKLVATNTNGIVLVVGLDKTKSATLKQALEGFKLSSVLTLGVVANGMKNL